MGKMARYRTKRNLARKDQSCLVLLVLLDLLVLSVLTLIGPKGPMGQIPAPLARQRIVLTGRALSLRIRRPLTPREKIVCPRESFRSWSSG
jgi:hypothetical protein